MVPIVADDIVQATVEGTNERTPWAWVSHYRALGVAGTSTFIDLLDTLIADLFTELQSELTTEFQAECVKFTRVAPGPMNVLYRDANYPIVGEVATDGVPNAAAALIRFTTDEAGPWNRGRMFLCGIPEANTNGGQLTTGKAALITTAFAAWMVGFSSGGDSAVPVVFSRTLYGTDPPGHPASVNDYSSQITAATCQNNLATIRNRRFPRNVSG